MKRKKWIRGAAWFLILTLFATGGAFAAEEQTINNAGDAQVAIGITVEPPQMNVTLPTVFPVAVSESGEVKTMEGVKIVNNSTGSVVVTKIEVRGYTPPEGDTATKAWTLTGFRDDLWENGATDSNLIGFSLLPAGGRNTVKSKGALTTDNSSASEQTLLDTKSADWVIDAKNDSATDELTILYNACVTPVSEVVNQQVASIVITIGWNTAD